MSVATPPNVEAASEDIVVRNPRTGEILYSVPGATPDEVKRVYKAAYEAFEGIRRMTVRERLNELGKLRRHILAKKEEIIDKIISETGKSRMDALLTEIFTVLDVIDYHEKNAERILADETVKTPILLMGKKSKIYYEPMGPVLLITPWNYPFNLTLIPFICAFAAGNSAILKPSEHTPLKGLIEDIIRDSGFCQNALQVVYGGKDTGKNLIDGQPAKILFTGSVRAGHQVMAQAAQYLIPVELELGGKDPMVVFEDVNIERAVNGAIWGGMTNSGQTCTAVERVFVHEKIYDQFVEELKGKINNLGTLPKRENSGDNGDLDMGCMTTDFQIAKVEEQVNEAVGQGATVVCGGKRVGESYNYEPTVLTGVTPDMAIYKDETFGPVITVTKFSSEDDAVRMSNDSVYGLSSSVWSADLERAERVARRLDAGSVSVNNVIATLANSALPFGGTKESGIGRYKGTYGLRSFTNIKSVLVDKNSSLIELNWYPYTKEKYELFTKLLDTAFSGKPFATLKAALIGIKLQALGKKQKL